MLNSMQRLWLAGGACLLLAGCGGDNGDKDERREEPAEHAAPTGEIKPAPDGKVIEVHMYSDEKGNYFKPNTIDAKKGDVIKFELKTGVHNVNFLADSNPGKTGLPKMSDMLQLPGQEYLVYVAFEPGRYYFQCDPHALLGMVGRLTVK